MGEKIRDATVEELMELVRAREGEFIIYVEWEENDGNRENGETVPA